MGEFTESVASVPKNGIEDRTQLTSPSRRLVTGHRPASFRKAQEQVHSSVPDLHFSVVVRLWHRLLFRWSPCKSQLSIEVINFGLILHRFSST